MTVKLITPDFKQYNKQLNNNNSNHSSEKTAAGISFTGPADALIAAPAVFLRFLDTNQAWGANLVDVGSMVIPRTYYDTKHRGLATGLETGRRESTGTFNHAMVGVYGTVLGAALAVGINKAYDMRAHKIFANNETLNILGDQWYKSVKKYASTLPENVSVKTVENDILDDYLKQVVSNIKVYNPSHPEAVENMVSISEDVQSRVVTKLKDLIQNGSRDTIESSNTNYIRTLITADTGGEKSVILKGFKNNNPIQADNTLSTLIENIHNVTKAFNKDKVINNFKEAVTFDKIEILNSLKKLNISRSAAGLGFAALFGMSVQPMNMYLTRKKTGCDGFPGVPGREKDKSLKFKIIKTAMAVLFGAGALSTIMVGGSKKAAQEAGKVIPKTEQLKKFVDRFLAKIQFKGMMPTINQLKFVYGMTIVSRLLCARDENELRESAVKDSLGFLNLLILGGLVTKGVTRLFNKNLINMPKDAAKGFMSWMKNSSVKSRDEILLSTLRKYNKEVVKDGKALSYGKLLQLVKQLPKAEKSVLRKQLLALDAAQLVGYAYSGIFLGYYLPKINDKMSKANEERRIAKLAKAQGKTVEQVKAEMEAERKRMEKSNSVKPSAKASKKTENNFVKPDNQLYFNSVRLYKEKYISEKVS